MPSTTLSSYALTTLASAKRHMRITSSGDDTLITELINAATDRIERICGRELAARDYVEVWPYLNSRTVKLKRFPLTRVNRLAYGEQDAMSVVYSGAAVRATVQVTYSAVRLHSIATDGTITQSELTFATYPLTSLLDNAISAISGWAATALVDVKSTDLVPMPGTKAKSTTVYLEAPNTEATDYYADLDTGIVTIDEVTANWPHEVASFENVVCEYRAGYETVPDELGFLCNEIVADAYHTSKRDGTLQSESIGDYSYTNAVNGAKLTDDQRIRLSRWMEYRV